MTTEPRIHKPAGGDGLMFVVAASIVVVVIVEGLFIAYSSWWLMSLVLLLVIAAAVGVCLSLVRLIDHDSAFVRPPLRTEPAPAPAARRVPAPTSRAAVTH
jgi:fatty-acid desaturase